MASKNAPLMQLHPVRAYENLELYSPILWRVILIILNSVMMLVMTYTLSNSVFKLGDAYELSMLDSFENSMHVVYANASGYGIPMPVVHAANHRNKVQMKLLEKVILDMEQYIDYEMKHLSGMELSTCVLHEVHGWKSFQQFKHFNDLQAMIKKDKMLNQLQSIREDINLLEDWMNGGSLHRKLTIDAHGLEQFKRLWIAASNASRETEKVITTVIHDNKIMTEMLRQEYQKVQTHGLKRPGLQWLMLLDQLPKLPRQTYLASTRSLLGLYKGTVDEMIKRRKHDLIKLAGLPPMMPSKQELVPGAFERVQHVQQSNMPRLNVTLNVPKLPIRNDTKLDPSRVQLKEFIDNLLRFVKFIPGMIFFLGAIRHMIGFNRYMPIPNVEHHFLLYYTSSRLRGMFLKLRARWCVLRLVYPTLFFIGMSCMYYDVLKSGARVNCQTSTPSLYDTVLSSLGLFEYSPTSLQNQTIKFIEQQTRNEDALLLHKTMFLKFHELKSRLPEFDNLHDTIINCTILSRRTDQKYRTLKHQLNDIVFLHLHHLQSEYVETNKIEKPSLNSTCLYELWESGQKLEVKAKLYSVSSSCLMMRLLDVILSGYLWKHLNVGTLPFAGSANIYGQIHDPVLLYENINTVLVYWKQCIRILTVYFVSLVSSWIYLYVYMRTLP